MRRSAGNRADPWGADTSDYEGVRAPVLRPRFPNSGRQRWLLSMPINGPGREDNQARDCLPTGKIELGTVEPDARGTSKLGGSITSTMLGRQSVSNGATVGPRRAEPSKCVLARRRLPAAAPRQRCKLSRRLRSCEHPHVNLSRRRRAFGFAHKPRCARWAADRFLKNCCTLPTEMLGVGIAD